MTPPQDQIQITLNHVLNLIKLRLERKQFPQSISLLVQVQFHYNKTLGPVWNLLLHGYLIYELLLQGAVEKLSLDEDTGDLGFSWAFPWL